MARLRGDGCGARSKPRVVAKHVAEVLDVRAATRCVRDDSVETGAVDLGMQPLDERRAERCRAALLAEMMHERAAAPVDRDDLDAATLEQADRRRVDLRRDD